MSAPDGNYFSVTILVVSTYLFIRMTTSSQWEHFNQLFCGVISIFVILNIVFVFVTHPSWGTGTRFSNDKILPYVSEEEKFSARDEYMKSIGVYEIYENLKETDGKRNILSDGATNMSILNARVERAEYF